MGTVGSVTIGVKADSTQFEAGMAKNQATVNKFAQSAVAAGKTTAGAMGEAAEQSVIVSQGLEAGTQAATRFATAAGMIGAALRTAFPVFGAFALLDVLEKIADNKFQKAAVELGDSFRTMNLSLETSIDTLKLSTAKMQEQIDLLSGKRPNTLAEDLANAALAADKLASSLDADNRKIAELLRQQRVGAFQGMFTNRAGTADVEGSVNSFNEDLAHLSAVYQHAVRTGSPDVAKDLKALEDKRDAAMRYQSDQLEQRQRLQAQKVGPNQDANIAILTGFGDTLVDQADLEADEKQNKATASKLKKLEDDKKFNAEQAAAHKKAQEELLKADEEEEKRRNAHNKVTINEEIQFWNDRIAAFTKGGDQFKTVQDKIYDLIARRPSLFAENKKNQAAAGKSQVEGEDLLGNAQKALITTPAIQQAERASRALEKYNEEVQKGIEIQQRASTAFQESSVRLAVMQGVMSRLEAAQAMAAIHADDHAKSLERINQALAEQIRLIGEIPAEKMSGQDRQSAIAAAQQAAQNQRSSIEGSYDITRQQDQQAISSQQLGPAVQQALGRMVNDWSSMTQVIVQTMTRSIDSLNEDITKAITGHGKASDFGRTFSQAGESLIKGSLQSVEGNLLKAFKIGGAQKADGSKNNPFYVVMGEGPDGTSGRSSGSSGLPAFVQPFFGGKQGGGSSNGADQSGGSIWSRIGNAFLPGLFGRSGSGAAGGSSGGDDGDGIGFDDMFQGGFAGGGDFMANRPMIVGEKGPELISLPWAGHVTPNNQIGGGDTHIYHIDARASSDPAAIHAAVARALPHAVAASVQANHQAKMRSPGGR